MGPGVESLVKQSEARGLGVEAPEAERIFIFQKCKKGGLLSIFLCGILMTLVSVL